MITLIGNFHHKNDSKNKQKRQWMSDFGKKYLYKLWYTIKPTNQLPNQT